MTSENAPLGPAVGYEPDSSWSNHGNRRGTKLHRPSTRDEVMSACGSCVINDESPWPPAEVPDRMRCRRSGCRQAWALLDDRTESSCPDAE